MLGWKVPSLGVKDGVTSLVQSWQGYPCHIGSGGQKLSVLQISCEGVPKPIWTGCCTGTIVLWRVPSFQQLRWKPQWRTWKMMFRPENGKLKLMFPQISGGFHLKFPWPILLSHRVSSRRAVAHRGTFTRPRAVVYSEVPSGLPTSGAECL